ncbi:hypothetical protein ABEW50_20820 [Paenibacillus jamilae]
MTDYNMKCEARKQKCPCELGKHHSLIAREIERGNLRACIRSPGRLNRLIVAAASSASVGNDKPKLANELTEKLVQVRKRETFGHWELDTVVSSRGESKACEPLLLSVRYGTT